MYDYYQKSYEAHERISRRRREAEAERIIRQARGEREGRSRLRIPILRQAARLRAGA